MRNLNENSSDLIFDKIYENINEGQTPDAVIETPNDIVPTVPEIVEEKKEEIVETKDNFKSIDDLTLAALALKEQGYIDLEKDKDVTLEDLVSSIESKRKKEAEEWRNTILEQAGQYRNYMEMKLNGVDDQIIEDIASKTLVSKIKLELDPNDNETPELLDKIDANREKIIKEELKYKGVPEQDHDDLIETIKSKGRLKERSLESKKFFENEETARAQFEIQEEKRLKQEEYNYIVQLRDQTEKLISSKKLAGYDLTDEDSKALKDFVFTKNKVVLVDNGTTKVPEKLSEYDIKLREYETNIEAQLAFAFWLMKGSSFIPIKSQGKVEQNKSIFDEIKRRSNVSQKQESNETNDLYRQTVNDLVYGK